VWLRSVIIFPTGTQPHTTFRGAAALQAFAPNLVPGHAVRLVKLARLYAIDKQCRRPSMP